LARPAKELEEGDPAALVARCYVFGDAVGGKVGTVKRAWETAVLKAQGRTPKWAPGKKLAPESRTALASIDLHFHDLRHEGASRLLEAGCPLHHVQHMHGHANLSQTSTYLNATRIGLHESMRRFDDLSAGCNPVASNPAIEHPPVRNDEHGSDAKLLVN
jgi:integrase